MEKLTIIYRCPADLKPNPRNARTHSEKQIRQIMRSIEVFGFSSAVILGSDDTILCGHGRVRGAVALGMQSVPTVTLEHLSEAQRRAFMIADNKIAQMAGWDEELLAIELDELSNLDCDIEITDTGFEMPEVDVLIEALKKPLPIDDGADHELLAADVPSVASPGDLWLLGKHLLFCGDALDPHSYQILLNGERAQMVFTDPPYNLKVNGHVSGHGRAKHREGRSLSG